MGLAMMNFGLLWLALACPSTSVYALFMHGIIMANPMRARHTYLVTLPPSTASELTPTVEGGYWLLSFAIGIPRSFFVHRDARLLSSGGNCVKK